MGGRHVIFVPCFLAPAAPLFRGRVRCTATAAALANYTSADKLSAKSGAVKAAQKMTRRAPISACYMPKPKAVCGVCCRGVRASLNLPPSNLKLINKGRQASRMQRNGAVFV